MSTLLISTNENIQTYEEFLEDFKTDPSVTILGKNCLSLLHEYAQLNGQILAFQLIFQSGQSHQPT